MEVEVVAAVCAGALFAGTATGAFVGTAWAKMAQAEKHREMERRIAGVEALLVESIGQSTRCFREEMEKVMGKMDAKKGRK